MYTSDNTVRRFSNGLMLLLLSRLSSIRPSVRCGRDGLELGAPEHIIKLVPMSSRWCSPLYPPAVLGNTSERHSHYLGDVLHVVAVSIVTLYHFYAELAKLSLMPLIFDRNLSFSFRQLFFSPRFKLGPIFSAWSTILAPFSLWI